MSSMAISDAQRLLEKLWKVSIKEVVAAVTEAQTKSLAKAYSVASLKLELQFNKLVQEFYSSYNPKFYSRSEDMYNVLEVGSDTNEKTVSIYFNDENMKQFERNSNSGETLFDLTFVGGFHGGAIGTDSNGISVKTPTYRKPMLRFTSWGSPAVGSKISPYDKFVDWIMEYFTKGKFHEDFNYYFETIYPYTLSSRLKSLGLYE